jgi:hypothetical protein
MTGTKEKEPVGGWGGEDRLFLSSIWGVLDLNDEIIHGILLLVKPRALSVESG